MKIPFYTNRIGIPPRHIEPYGNEGEAVKVARLLWEMVFNGPTDGDAGFWLEPQASELWGIYIALCQRIRCLEDELFETGLSSVDRPLSVEVEGK